MDTNQVAQALGNVQSADRTALDSETRPLDPEPSLGAPWSQLRQGRFDQMAVNYSPSQAAASSTHDSHYRHRRRDDHAAQGQKGDAMDSVTESGVTTEDVSFYSYHSARDLSTFVKEVDGRMFNTQSDLYVLPSDDGEFQRLDKQHYALVLSQGGLYPSECDEIVREILSSRNGDGRHAILDLGCGSGIWTIEMAREFPDCDVIGVDLAPAPVDIELLPINCRFEIDDINLGMSHYHNTFSIIHVRCIGSGLASHAKTMRDVEACLKPGGIVFFIDGDMTCYQENMLDPIPLGLDWDEGGDPDEGSWLHRIMREIRDAAVYNGCDVDGLENCIDEGLWEHELIDPATVRAATLCTPVGTWARAQDPDIQQRLNYTGSLIRQDFMRATRGWHPMLKKYGIPQVTLNRWSERIDAELNNEKFRMCMRWRFTWGRRKSDDADNIPIDAIRGHSSPSPGAVGALTPVHAATPFPASNSTDFKFMDVLYTKEDAAAVMAMRRMKVRDLPETMVVRIRRPSD